MKMYLFTIVLLLFGLNSFGQLDSGLIAKYYFNNGNANDDSGNGYDADTVNATLTVDRFGNTDRAYSFDGLQFINIPYSAPFNLDEISISVWFKVLNPDSLWQRIVTFPVSATGGNQHFSIMYNFSPEPYKIMTYFDQANNQGAVYAVSNDTVNNNLWHHFVGTISTSNLQIISYLDGIPVDTTSFTNAPTPADGHLQIGRFNYTFNENFIGDIDDIRLYDRAISALEVDSLFNEENSTVGILSLEPETSFSVFPNPFKNILNIQNESNLEIQFTLYNSLGIIIYEEALKSKTSKIDLSSNPSGIYFYKLTDNKNLIKTGKLIKQ